jgi:Restriction endonuclease
MKIELREVTVRELTAGYIDNSDTDNGVFGYGGKLDIRPPYQREFIYKEPQRNAVINTVMSGFPLNVMYWAKREDEHFEIIDGQQRTISLCQYVHGDFSFDMRYFHNLENDEQDKVLNYKLMIYVCQGTDSEKLSWFKTINIAGEQLTDQELRNAVYAGSWLSDAKKFFSKNACVAYQTGKDYLNGSANRQEYLETAIKWISHGNIETYMANHQHDENANALWQYFQGVITWVESNFTRIKKHTKIIKGIEWGELYNKYKDNVFDTKAIEKKVNELLLDDDVSNKKGIYPYIITKEERCLSIRTFSEAIKLAVYEKQKGICPLCNEHFEIEQMEADHITPWCEGGKTLQENCQMLCKDCNRRKSNK